MRGIVLPGITIALTLSPILIRSLRASMIDVLSSDYIVTARAKGIGIGVGLENGTSFGAVGHYDLRGLGVDTRPHRVSHYRPQQTVCNEIRCVSPFRRAIQ